MPMINPFTTDGFSLVALTDAINVIPNMYGKTNELGLFTEKGVRTRTVIVDEKDGSRVRRTYAFQGYHVRLESKEPWNHPLQTSPPPDSAAKTTTAKSYFSRLGETLAGLRRKFFGR